MKLIIEHAANTHTIRAVERRQIVGHIYPGAEPLAAEMVLRSNKFDVLDEALAEIDDELLTLTGNLFSAPAVRAIERIRQRIRMASAEVGALEVQADPAAQCQEAVSCAAER